MNRIKVFVADMYEKNNKASNVYDVQEEIQKQLELWFKNHPTYSAVNTSISISKEEAILSVVYTDISLSFERSK